MDEDGPNFSYAYGHTSAAPSWNPALRPDHETDNSPASIARQLQPSPQIIPQSKMELDQSLDDEDELPAIPTASAIPAHVSNGVPEHEPNSDDDFFDRYGSGEVTKSTPRMSSDEIHEDGVNGATEGGAEASIPWAEETPQAYEPHTNGASLIRREDQSEPGATVASPDAHPEEKYEHQGETTLLEDALIESDQAPLVVDAEPIADDWGNSGEVFDLGGMPQDAPLNTPLDAPMETPQAEAVGTTIGDQVIGSTKVGGNAGEDIDWGNAEGDDFFGGAAAIKSVVPQQPSEEGAGAHVVSSSTTQPTAGTDGVWDLDLDMDDDFLPDNEETPAFDLDDDEGFLEDETAAAVQQPMQTTTSASNTKNKYAPQAAQATPQPLSNPYAAPGPQFTNTSQTDQKQAASSLSPAYGVYNQPSPYQQQPTRPTMPSHELSFADKSKGGYHSPYDLPDDIVTSSRKRPTPRTSSIPTAQPTPPPPRSSSISGTSAVPRGALTSSMSAASLSPPSSSHSMQSQMMGMPPNAPPKATAMARAPSNEFFAELPIETKPRPSGRYTPQQGVPQHPSAPGFASKERTASWSSLRNEILPDSDKLVSQLQQPERLPVFPDQPTAPVRTNSLPVPHPAPASSSNRYSPAPPSAPSAPPAPHANARYSPAPPAVPAANSRYSPAPPQAAQAPGQTHHHVAPPHGPPRPPYAPRTSSPLAYHSTPEQEVSSATQEQYANNIRNHQAKQAAEGPLHAPFKSHLEGVSEVVEQAPTQSAGPPTTARSETPPLRSGPPSAVSSPRKKSNYTPQYQSTQPTAPPARAQSQSPSATMKQPHQSVSYNDQSTPAYGIMSPSSTLGAPLPVQNVNVIPHRRQMSHDYECIPPNDDRAADPLQRWRGYPIFKWGLGGTVITSFPKQIPRYGGGATMPMMKCSPGEVKIQNVKEVLPLPEEISKFPGPLKAKGKKKDVSAWLGRKIEILQNQLNVPGLEQSMSAEDLKRLEERSFLWQVMQVFIDNDGHLDGNATVDAAVRKVLSPDSGSSVEGAASFSTAADIVGVSRSNTALQAEPLDMRAIEELRNHLTAGDREKAVWHAVDQRLWGHAMLLSSTLNKDVWKQVVQEFVRKEVKKIGGNNQALAVLYEIFAGNHEDCIDELVPASARAGFQMMSTDGAGSMQNGLQGLDKWRETLSLILNNRSDGDAAALLSLGRLLASYGRVEAAHVCFIFARSVAYLGGVDDHQSDIVLVGADHRSNPLELGIDLEPVLLTEVYEFGLSLSAHGGSHIIPHLQSYKLSHAYQLAEYGYRTDAQAYCDAIAATMKSTTRISPYYNGSFVASLDDLSRRLSQSPKDGSSSWISKPSMDKVSSSLLSKFNSFIAGEDDDAASNHSGGAEVGPFAKIAGDTPTLTPAQSSADLYGAYSGFGTPSATPSAPTNSRYAPSTTANAYAPRTSMESSRSRYEPQGRPSLESSDGVGMRAVSDTYIPSPQFSGPYTPAQPQRSPGFPSPQLTKSQSYSPLRSDSHAPQPSYGSPYQPTPSAEESTPAFGGYNPPQATFDATPAESTEVSSGYEPPSTAYEPPSYQPYEPNQEEEPSQETKSKKKSFMDDDDDDDLAARAAALKGKQKSAADRAADEAFRKAAEEDAKRDKEARKSGSWFGGWFKKDPNAQQSGPIKAKLGEENSFYYDPELKKWVNKKAGAAEASKPIATPPPPRSGPPSRSASGTTMGPPSSLPHSSHLSAPPSRPPTSNPQRSSSMPPPMSIPGSRASTPGIPSDSEGPKPPVLMPPTLAAGSGPPSRPGTGMSTASSIDDLLGAPQARKGATAKKKKGGRYVDVMAQK